MKIEIKPADRAPTDLLTQKSQRLVAREADYFSAVARARLLDADEIARHLVHESRDWRTIHIVLRQMPSITASPGLSRLIAPRSGFRLLRDESRGSNRLRATC